MKITGVSDDGRRCGKQEEIMTNVDFQFVVNQQQQQQLASLDKFQLGLFLGSTSPQVCVQATV
jgi:hypothetical protein